MQTEPGIWLKKSDKAANNSRNLRLSNSRVTSFRSTTKPCRSPWECRITLRPLRPSLKIISFRTVILVRHRVPCMLRTLSLGLAKINTVPAFQTPQISTLEGRSITTNQVEGCSWSTTWIRETTRISPEWLRLCSPTSSRTCSKSLRAKDQLMSRCLENLGKKKGTTIWRTFRNRSWVRTTIRKPTLPTRWTSRKSSHLILHLCLQHTRRAQCDELDRSSTVLKATTTAVRTWEYPTSLPATMPDRWGTSVKTRSLLQVTGFPWSTRREWVETDPLTAWSLSRLLLWTSSTTQATNHTTTRIRWTKINSSSSSNYNWCSSKCCSFNSSNRWPVWDCPSTWARSQLLPSIFQDKTTSSSSNSSSRASTRTWIKEACPTWVACKWVTRSCPTLSMISHRKWVLSPRMIKFQSLEVKRDLKPTTRNTVSKSTRTCSTRSKIPRWEV